MPPDPHLTTYPFTPYATAYVKDLEIPIPDLLKKHVYARARSRGMVRVIQAIEGEIKSNTEIPSELELLSYPIARMLVSCIDEEYLIRRYALAEAKVMHEALKTESLDFLIAMGHEFGMCLTSSDQGLEMHFAEYTRYATRMHAPEWKLVNRQLHCGLVTLSMREFRRLLQEAIRDHIQQDLPLPVSPEIHNTLSQYITEVSASLGARKTEFKIDDGAVEPDAFPPCIVHTISLLQAGTNLSHSARFAATAFLLNIGMDVDGIIRVFGGSPDFDETRTRYQVEHISGSEYTAPGCNTMKTYGNCAGADGLCTKIKHPLNYYRIKKK